MVYKITVSGLTFEPTVIIAKYNDGTQIYETIYQNCSDDLTQYSIKLFSVDDESLGSTTNYHYQTSTNAYVNSTSFQLPVGTASVSYSWIAYA
jgi:hypothetical protein